MNKIQRTLDDKRYLKNLHDIQVIVYMKHVGKSHREIAQSLGKTENAVINQQRRYKTEIDQLNEKIQKVGGWQVVERKAKSQEFYNESTLKNMQYIILLGVYQEVLYQAQDEVYKKLQQQIMTENRYLQELMSKISELRSGKIRVYVDSNTAAWINQIAYLYEKLRREIQINENETFNRKMKQGNR